MVPSSVWDVGSAKNPFFFVQIIQLQNYVNHKYLREGDKNSKGKFISLIFPENVLNTFLMNNWVPFLNKPVNSGTNLLGI